MEEEKETQADSSLRAEPRAGFDLTTLRSGDSAGDF